MSLHTISIILASQSPQRKILMDTLRIPYTTMPADINELAIVCENQCERAALIAKEKGQTIRDRLTQTSDTPKSLTNPHNIRTIILAADTFLVDTTTNVALEKPASIDEARQMLQYQSGKDLIEHTGVYWFDSGSPADENFGGIEATQEWKTVTSHITFRELSNQEIEFYISTEPVTTWSGSFCPAYPTGAAFIAQISGSFTGFTHGFPLDYFVPKLRAAGISF